MSPREGGDPDWAPAFAGEHGKGVVPYDCGLTRSKGINAEHVWGDEMGLAEFSRERFWLFERGFSGDRLVDGVENRF